MTVVQIGTTLENMTALADLATPVPEPTALWRNGVELVELGNGQRKWLGLPIQVWDFALLAYAERTMLKSFCSGASADVYILAKDNDGNYAPYAATLWWPEEEERASTDDPANLRLEFRDLVIWQEEPA